MKETWSVAAIQTDILWENPQANLKSAKEMLGLLRFPVDLVIFPETFLSGYTMNSRKFAEEKFGVSESFLGEAAKEKGAICGGGWIQMYGEKAPFNTFSLVEPNSGRIHRYQKMHPFTYAGEHKFFTAGKELITFNYNGWNISPLICYDLRFPEAFRKSAGETDLYIVVANWPEERIQHWSCLLQARAIENQAYVLGVNRVGKAGKNKKINYPGKTALYNPKGENLLQNTDKEGILSAEISYGELQEYRRKYPFLQDTKEL
ncbi:MAG: nitrilase-related carbon-nitrogen hydrolase [Spirochaetota bacterium]